MPHSAYISSKDWSIEHLLGISDNFSLPRVIDASSPDLVSIIRQQETHGTPLVISGWHKHSSWRPAFFNSEYFSHQAPSEILVRDIHNWTDNYVSTLEFFAALKHIPQSIQDDETVRYYAKDVQCPILWEEWLLDNDNLPSCLCPNAEDNVLPEATEIETLMCYIGVGDTATPAHKDLCASTGQNLMMYTEENGSSFWFMTDSKSSPAAVDYFHQLGHELDHELHFTSPKEFGNAPFQVYVWEQRLGDLIVIPPRCCHQVTNHGGMTIKMSWSRLSLKDLPAALYHELPMYQRLCRRETYRIKEIIRSTLKRKSQQLSETSRDTKCNTSAQRTVEIIQETQTLLALFASILEEEMPPSSFRIEQGTLPLDSETGLFCDFCGADIFNTYFSCDLCTAQHDTVLSEEADCVGFCICSRCFLDGRSCGCRLMRPHLIQPHSILQKEYEQANIALNMCISKTFNNAPVCQIQSSRDDSIQSVRIFEAAFRVFTSRRLAHKQPIRNCGGSRKGNKAKHPVSSDCYLYCKKCHAGTCLKHILSDYSLHAAEVFLLQLEDSTSELWHARHKEASARSKNMMMLMQDETEAEAKGIAPRDHFLHLARITSRFSLSKPLSQNCHEGWYDTAFTHDTDTCSSILVDPRVTTSTWQSAVDYPTVSYVNDQEDEHDENERHVEHYSDSPQHRPSSTTSTLAKRKLLLPFVAPAGLRSFHCSFDNGHDIIVRPLSEEHTPINRKKQRT